MDYKNFAVIAFHGPFRKWNVDLRQMDFQEEDKKEEEGRTGEG